MQIVIKERTDSNGCAHERLIIDDEEECSVYPLCECPEDATIERDLISCTDIAGFMRRAYEAGKNGEEFVITSEPDEEY
jgi:hypothetical protein